MTAELERLDGIAAGAEWVWTRLYVKGMAPEQAAKAPEVYNYITRSRGCANERDRGCEFAAGAD